MNRRSAIPSPATPPGRFTRYGARVFDDERQDPYHPREKLTDATHCRKCGAVYRHGRWQWEAPAESGGPATCPACRRVQDRLPAGRLMLDGPYAAAHREELVRIACNQAEEECSLHPMHRIMRVEERKEDVEITTTDIHLPRRIGEALKRAHDGDLTIVFAKDAYEVRVHWHR